jgi:hypothetical protein
VFCYCVSQKMYLQAGGPALLMDVFPLPFFLIRICSDSLFGLVPFEKESSFCDERQRPWNFLMLNETLDYLLY